MNQVDKVLINRGSVYGDFSIGSNAFANIMGELAKVYEDKHGAPPSMNDFIHIWYQVMKLVRLAATPNHIDSWVDIQGYAKLSQIHFEGVDNATQI
jgi:hypothetical protein